MSDTNKALFNLEKSSTHFSQLGSIQEASLAQLREQIKKMMIPLLIKVFQSQMDLVGTNAQESKKAYEQLILLDRDLQNLQLWCQSCRSQIQSALTPPAQMQKSFVMNPDFLKAHLGANKSFFASTTFNPKSSSSDKAWWKTLLKKS